MSFVLFCLSLLQFSSALPTIQVRSNKIVEFEKRLATFPETTTECYEKLVCIALSSLDSETMTIRNEVEESLFAIMNEFEATPMKIQEQLINTKKMVASVKKIMADGILNCDTEVLDCFVNIIDLFKFRYKLKNIINEMSINNASLHTDKHVFQEKKSSSADKTAIVQRDRRDTYRILCDIESHNCNLSPYEFYINGINIDFYIFPFQVTGYEAAIWCREYAEKLLSVPNRGVNQILRSILRIYDTSAWFSPSSPYIRWAPGEPDGDYCVYFSRSNDFLARDRKCDVDKYGVLCSH